MIDRWDSEWARQNKKVSHALAVAKPDDFICKLCGAKTGIYRRKLHFRLCQALAQLYRDGGWLHYSELEAYTGGRGDSPSKMDPWEITQYSCDTRKFHITEKGVDFVDGKILVRKYAMVIRDELQGWAGPELNFIQCAGERFDYEETVGHPPPKCFFEVSKERMPWED